MRRLWLALFLSVAVLASAGTAVATEHAKAGGGIAFIVNSGGASISVIDMATRKESGASRCCASHTISRSARMAAACWSATPPATR
jgi:hypothetical protein